MGVIAALKNHQKRERENQLYINMKLLPVTTVFHGVLYPPNVHEKLPMGTGIREKLGEGHTINGAPKIECTPPTHHPSSSQEEVLAKHASQIVNMPRRKTYSNRQKLQILNRIDELLESEEEPSLRSCCREVGIQPCQARKWRTLRDKLRKHEAIN